MVTGRPLKAETEVAEAIEDTMALLDEFLEDIAIDFRKRLAAKYAGYPHFAETPHSTARRSA